MVKRNDRWSQLSMQQRADLIKLYIDNGITNVRDIRKHYNSFDDGIRMLDGTEEEQTLSGKKPTLEEFLQAKADSTRNAALEKSYARTKGVLIPYAFGEGEREAVKERLEAAMPYAIRFTYGPFTSEQEEFEVKNANYFLGNYYQAKKELEDNCKYGFNCIGTATDNYPEESRTVSNIDFDANFEKYGFQYVGMKNAKPGDIAKTSDHAMIYVGTDVNGNPLFNYSDGGITEYDYKKDAKYPAPYYGVYRYVGTPELIQQWTEEYNTNRSKKCGGKLNKFATGGSTEKDIYIEELPGVVVTPNGNYIKYSSNNKDVSFEDYKESRVQQDRINAVNNILNQESPLVPQVPNLLARALIKAGFSENFATKLCGYAKNPHTCIYTATGMYPKGSQVAGNKTFADSYTDYGFEKVDNIQKGDMLQLFNGNGVPYHAVMVTGFAEDGSPLLSYANGGIDRDLNKNGILDESEKNMRYNKNNLYDDGDDNTPDFAIARDANEDEAYDIFRYVGNPEQINTYFKEYKRMYDNKNKK